MENQLISVVMAVYNVEKYLDACVKSVCAQTYRNLQIILVDDGSKDNSGALCDEWAQKDNRILVIHQKNAGVSAARNEGISHAKGRYLVFSDSDDVMEPDFVERLLQAHQEGNLTMGGYYIDCVSGEQVRSCIRVYCKEEVSLVSRKQAADVFAAGLLSVIWNKLYETAVLSEHNIRFAQGISLGEDILFNLTYLRVLEGNMAIVNVPIYHYMKRGVESLDHKYREDYAAIQKMIFEAFLDYLNDVSADCGQKERIRSLYFNAMIVTMDNLYANKKHLPREVYRAEMRQRKEDPTVKKLISELSGSRKWMAKIRWGMVMHGLFGADYYLRRVIKRVLGLE